MGEQDSLSWKLLDFVDSPIHLLVLKISAFEEDVDRLGKTMLIFSSIKTNKLYSMTLVPEAEEGKLLIHGFVFVISLEMIVERASEGVIIVITRNRIIP